MEGKIEEHSLISALGLTKTVLAYALEVFVRAGFLNYKRVNNDLNINISIPSRQNFEELIEYNLLESELRQISVFRSWLCSVETKEIKNLLSESKLNSESILNNVEERVVL
jgi:hypothetical protein